MQICLVGDFSPNLDEGYKNTSHYLARELSVFNEVFCLDHKAVSVSSVLDAFKHISPQVIHAITRPTYQSLYFSKLLNLRWEKAKTVISALKPEGFFLNNHISFTQRILLSLAKPDLITVQTEVAERLFQEAGYRTYFWPNGVDTGRFSPASENEKQNLKIKYSIDLNKPVILHVGHLEVARNLAALEPLIIEGMQVVVAGSVYMGVHRQLIDDLKSKGFTIFEGYQPNVEELFRLADCYVFPLNPCASLSMPLSVLEAMSTNLPVVTRRFQGLVDNFCEGNGLYFADQADDILMRVRNALASQYQTNTRSMVERFSWTSLAQQIQDQYQKLVEI